MIGARPVLDGRYELGEELGRGGMATVRRARDLRLGREAAVKVLHPDVAEDPDAMRAFRAEAMSSARLSHPGIVSVYDVGEAAIAGVRRPFLVMEMIEGTPLSSMLVDGTPLTIERSLEIAIDVAAALAHAHERGVVHRDVTPGNLLVLQTGQIKVTDFGIARAAPTAGHGPAATHAHRDAGARYGSVAYLSPEQARRGPVDARSDLYSVGCLLMTVLTGYPPFRGSDAEVVAHHLRTRPPAPSSRRPGLESLDGVVLRCLEKDPWRRPQSAAELRRDLLQLLGAIDAPAAWAAGANGLATVPPPLDPSRSSDIVDVPTARVGSALIPEPLPGEAGADGAPAGDAAAGGETTGEPSSAEPTPAEPSAGAPTTAEPTTQGPSVEEPAAGSPAPASETATATDMPDVLDVAGAADAPGGTGAAAVEPSQDAEAAATGEPPASPAEPGPAAPTVRRVPLPRAVWLTAVALLVLVPAAVLVALWPRPGGPGAAVGPVDLVTVPVTESLTVEAARESLIDAGFAIGDTRTVSSVEIPVGFVVGTDPAGGGEHDRGAEVDLLISSGPADVAVPNVDLAPLEEARQAIEDDNLVVGEVLEVPSVEPRGTVLDADPGFGRVRPEGTAVDLVVASGENEVPVVLGLPVGDATAAIEDAGFAVEVQRRESSVAEGIVLDTQPEERTLSRLGTTVTLVVSGTPVPEVTRTETATVTVGPGS